LLSSNTHAFIFIPNPPIFLSSNIHPFNFIQLSTMSLSKLSSKWGRRDHAKK
jgi:hypothetical protein